MSRKILVEAKADESVPWQFTASYKFHKMKINYVLLGLHKVTRWTMTLLFSHLAQLLDEMTDLISFQIVLEEASLFCPLAAILWQN